MRRRRLARLGGLESNGASGISNASNCLNSPSTPGPSAASIGFGVISAAQSQQLQSQPQPVDQQSMQSDTPMDTEENNEKQCNNSGIDVDSGIENMEVEESDRKDATPRSRVRKSEKQLFNVITNFLVSK